jgi:hypothetical protein
MTIAELLPKLRSLSRHEKLEVIQFLESELAQDETKISRSDFMKLPMERRQQILREQANAMVSHYQQDTEWLELETGDIIEY